MSKPMDSEQKARLFGRLCAIEDIATSIQSEVNRSDPDRADHDLWEEMETLKGDIRYRVNSMFEAYEDDDRIARADKSEQTFRELYLALKNLKEAIYGDGYRPYEAVSDDDPLYLAYNKAEELLIKFSPHPNPPSSTDDSTVIGDKTDAPVATNPDNRADPDVSKTAHIAANVTSKSQCPYGHSDHHSCGHCTRNGACDVTVLTSMPPQYNMCPFRGSGYIYCKDA